LGGHRIGRWKGLYHINLTIPTSGMVILRLICGSIRVNIQLGSFFSYENITLYHPSWLLGLPPGPN
jgi:hypothetical protein